MNANELLKQQHDEVKAAYQEFRGAGGAQKEKISKKILTDLTAHSAIEEELYYPELAKGDADDVNEFRAEHQAAKALITKLTLMKIDNEQYDPTMKALMEAVEHHIDEEESQGMPEAEKIMGEAKLAELGLKMKKRFTELQESTPKRLWAAVTS